MLNSVAQKDVHYVTNKDLPLCCPLPSEALWSAHPRVYLPLAEEGEVTCPYCSAHYVLKAVQGENSLSSGLGH